MMRRILTLMIATAALAAGAAIAPSSAQKAGEGWLRLGHLSPDTKSVDVRVSALAGGSTVFALKGVSYGDVSAYEDLPTGSYTVSMVPAGSAASTPPVISATVKIDEGSATTVTAYGPNDDLQVRAFDDDLSAPKPGEARVRLVQASTMTPQVDVTTSTGRVIAADARQGSATNYAEIPAGDWKLNVTGADVEGRKDVSVNAGTVTTLFVVDTKDAGLTILPVLDSAGSATAPRGGVDTGGGGQS